MARALCSLGTLTAILSLSVTASGYCLQKFPSLPGFVTWKQEVPYYISDNVTDPATVAAIDAAFAAWAAVPCTTFKVRKAGTFALGTQPFRDHGFGVYVFWHTAPEGYPTEPKFISHAFISVEGIGAEPGKVDIFDLRDFTLAASVPVAFQASGISFWEMNGG